MKLAGKKKLRKVRQTVYESPGNPFADDEEQEGISVFTMPFRPPVYPLDTVREGSPSRSPCDRAARAPARPAGQMSLLNGSPFEDAIESPAVAQSPVALPSAIHAPAPQRHGTPTLIKEHRSSMSVTVITENLAAQESESEYVSPRTLWQPGSEPSKQPPQGKKGVREEARNTKFYGFYDDILQDYNGRQSRML